MLYNTTALLSQTLLSRVEIFGHKFQLFITQPQDNIPAHQPHAASGESFVKRHSTLGPCSLHGHMNSSTIFATRTVHESGLHHVDRTCNKCSRNPGNNCT
eukprot:TRINITY_DN20208_c0_g1_i1.p1 TRINITY_DN20208_c0_g1~~TRINITY_DN20208_c0_g1_i1.p1  ORF type:complete len:100 (+),score=0.42 TRINITY_DN20208_c0_g1_i1:273-572(+)